MNYTALQRLQSRYHKSEENLRWHFLSQAVCMAAYISLFLVMGGDALLVMVKVWSITMMVGTAMCISFGSREENYTRAWHAYLEQTTGIAGQQEETGYIGAVVGFALVEFAFYEAFVWVIIGLLYGYRII